MNDDEYMTLAEALATGLPFKHKEWITFINPKDVTSEANKDFFVNQVWQVQRPKPKMRVFRYVGETPNPTKKPYHALVFGYEACAGWEDVTELLKEILKDSDNG